MNAERRKLIQFFLEHACYCTPPGRMVGARDLADAYLYAEAEEYTWEWVWDDDWRDALDMEFDNERQRVAYYKQPHEVLGCVLHDPNDNVVASLWGIVDPDDNYRRV